MDRYVDTHGVHYFFFLTVAEMASEDVHVYQNDEYTSASITADYPQSKYFTAHFTDNGFTVSADG